MTPRIEFTDERLSTVLEGLVAFEGPAERLVSPSLNLVLYPASIPMEAPPEDTDAEPEPRQCAIANDRRSPIFESVSGFVASDDGKLWACVGKDPDTHLREWQGQRSTEDIRWLVVNGEKKGELGAGRPFVDREGTAVAYTQTVWNPETGYPLARVVVGGEVGPLFQIVEPAGFGAGGRFAYKAVEGDECMVILDGKGVGAYGDVRELQWSPDGSRLAFAAGDPSRIERYAVLDGKKGPAFESVHGLRFSPDGRRFAYVAGEKGAFRPVLDGEPGATFPYCAELWFSGDGNTLLSRVNVEKRWTIAVNGRAGAAFDEVGPPVFSRDASTVAYAARRAGKGVVVVNGRESEPCDVVYRMAVGEKGGVAYAVLIGKTCLLVHNGREVSRGVSRPNLLAVGADGRSLACSEARDGKVRLVVDGEGGEEFDTIERLAFAPDGKTVVYAAREGERWFVVVGRTRHGPMEPLTDPVFNGSGDRLALVARIGREIWRKALPVTP